MENYWLALLFFLFVVLVFCWRVGNRFRRGKLLSGLIWSGASLLPMAVFFLFLLLLSNLYTYQRLTFERPIADIYIRKLQPQVFQVTIRQADNDSENRNEPVYFELQGDQWQLEARILKWKGWANLLGFDSYFQLRRLSGRYRSIEQARQKPVSAWSLSPPDRGLDIWKLNQHFAGSLQMVDTIMGQAVFMPMADGAHFEVVVGQSGLISRAVNEAARQAIFKQNLSQ